MLNGKNKNNSGPLNSGPVPHVFQTLFYLDKSPTCCQHNVLFLLFHQCLCQNNSFFLFFSFYIKMDILQNIYLKVKKMKFYGIFWSIFLFYWRIFISKWIGEILLYN